MTSLASHGIEDNNVREEIKTKTGGKTEALDPPYPERILVIMATMGDLMARPREGLLACLSHLKCFALITSHHIWAPLITNCFHHASQVRGVWTNPCRETLFRKVNCDKKETKVIQCWHLSIWECVGDTIAIAIGFSFFFFFSFFQPSFMIPCLFVFLKWFHYAMLML